MLAAHAQEVHQVCQEPKQLWDGAQAQPAAALDHAACVALRVNVSVQRALLALTTEAKSKHKEQTRTVDHVNHGTRPPGTRSAGAPPMFGLNINSYVRSKCRSIQPARLFLHRTCVFQTAPSSFISSRNAK